MQKTSYEMRISDWSLYVCSSHLACQLYTPGTSGWPKGALITNSNLTAFFRNAAEAMPLSPRGAQLVILPLFHVAALIGSLRTFDMGGHCVGQSAFDKDQMVELIARHQVRSFVMVNKIGRAHV